MKCLTSQVAVEVSTMQECFVQGGQAIVTAADVPTFNTEFFLLIHGFIMLSFITGHFGGRMVRWMNKI